MNVIIKLTNSLAGYRPTLWRFKNGTWKDFYDFPDRKIHDELWGEIREFRIQNEEKGNSRRVTLNQLKGCTTQKNGAVIFETDIDTIKPDKKGVSQEWLNDFLGVDDNLTRTLHAIDKHSYPCYSVKTNNSEWTMGPPKGENITEIMVRGIAWDGSDWEFSEVIECRKNRNLMRDSLDNAIRLFHDCLEEHTAIMTKS